MTNYNWNYPTTVWVGKDRAKDLEKACDEIKTLNPLLVTDKDLINLEFIKDLINDLEKKFKLSTFSNFSGNPTGENVDEGVELFKNNSCDSVIAIGGGSALDVGKAIAFMSPLSAELLQIKQPTGLVSTLAGLTSEQAGQTQYQIKDEAGKPRTVTVQHYNVKTDPSAIKPMPGKAPEFGGYAVGRAQPSIIQAFDSNISILNASASHLLKKTIGSSSKS